MKNKIPKNKDLTGKQKYTVSDSNSEWVLYHNNFSLCSRKVRICLEEYKIDYLPVHIHIIETKDCENLSKDFCEYFNIDRDRMKKIMEEFGGSVRTLYIHLKTNKIKI